MAVDQRSVSFYYSIITGHPDSPVTIGDASCVSCVYARVKEQYKEAFLANYCGKHIIAANETAKGKLAERMNRERNDLLKQANIMQGELYRLSMSRER
jgi:hypothetical protein